MDYMKRIPLAKVIRDSTHNLVVNEKFELDNEIFFDRYKCFIISLEGSKNKAYMDGIYDPKTKEFMTAEKFYSYDEDTQKKLKQNYKDKTNKWPITTVGIGLNIEPDSVKEKYNKLFGIEGLMERVSKGEADLTDEQIGIIFRDSIEFRYKEVRGVYGENWNKFRVNEKYTIMSLYFNFPKLANEKTSFYKHMTNYAKTSDKSHLREACDEVQYRSNLHDSGGIQNRRNAEKIMLNSLDVPTYTKPNEPPDCNKVKVAKLNETIIPLNCDSCAEGVNKDYFIWRTKLDNRVREEHGIREGKVYRRDDPPGGFMPGAGWNCRCHDEAVPDCILVNDEIVANKAFELYLRKGIKHPLLYIH